MNTTTTTSGEAVVVPAVVASHHFVQTIRETIDAIQAAKIDQHLRRVYEVVLPQHRALTATMGDAEYEVYTRASGFEDLHHELTHLARAARVALALSEADLVYPAWMPSEAVTADDAQQLQRARALVALFDDMAELMGGDEG